MPPAQGVRACWYCDRPSAVLRWPNSLGAAFRTPGQEYCLACCDLADREAAGDEGASVELDRQSAPAPWPSLALPLVQAPPSWAGPPPAPGSRWKPLDFGADGYWIPPPPPSIESQVLDFDALMRIQDPEPLIKGVLNLESAAMLYAPPGGFKSFVALDWACHIATGRDWQGCRVRKGAVFYLAGEGARGVRKRVAAWVKRYGTEPRDLFVLPVAVPAAAQGEGWGSKLGTSPEWLQAIAAAKSRGAVLVVIDTLHRMAGGLDENSAGDMGMFQAAVDQLKTATGACVLLVHHSGKAPGARERGSSGLRGAQDTMWKIERDGGMGALLSSEKEKDSGDDGFFPLQMESVDLGADAWGDPVSSLVVTADKNDKVTGSPGLMAVMRERKAEARKLENQRWIVQTLLGQDDPNGTGSTRSDLWRSYQELSKDQITPMARSTFHSVITELLEEREDPNRPGEMFQMIYETAKGRRLTLSDPWGGKSGFDRGYVEQVVQEQVSGQP